MKMLLTFMPPSNSLASFLNPCRAFWSNTAPFMVPWPHRVHCLWNIWDTSAASGVCCTGADVPVHRQKQLTQTLICYTEPLECKRPTVQNWDDDQTWSHPLQPLRHFLQLYCLLRILSASSSEPMCSSLKGGIWMKNSSQDCGPIWRR